jgi:ATP-dependent DNA ligase
VFDGELLVGRDFTPMNFNSLQQRLNRKKVPQKHMDEFPAFIKLYDILYLNNEDLRDKTDHINQNTLEKWFKKNKIEFEKYKNAKKTELEYMEKREKYFKEFFGNGELRYIIKKC